MKLLSGFIAILLCWPLVVPAQQQAAATSPKGAPIWNELKGEKLEALRLKGDATRGEEAFQVCQGCHRRGAVGTPSGAYPRLAGQHASVLIEQMTDIRSGRRLNPKMKPFVDENSLNTQEIVDIATYLQALPIPSQGNGQGPGTALDAGKALYVKDCAVCHGVKAEGNARTFVPLLAGQHYGYLLREGSLIRDERRGNANPDMVKVIKFYSDEDLQIVSDYLSRLAPP